MKTGRLQNEKKDTKPVRFFRSEVLSYQKIKQGRVVKISGGSMAEKQGCMKTNSGHIKVGLTETGDCAKLQSCVRNPIGFV